MKNQRALSQLFLARTGRTTAPLPSAPDEREQCQWFKGKAPEWLK